MAGYSGTPLPKKLGLREGQRVAILGVPPGFAAALGALPDGLRPVTALRGKALHDVIVCFVRSRADLERRYGALKSHLAHDGGLWLAWPKKSSGVATDVTEDVVRATALAGGLVDNKVCAIDETWSGLRLCYRRKDRPRA